MKYLSLLFILSASTFFTTSCGNDGCGDIKCVNGDCNNGECECETGWTGELCDEEKEPYEIRINKVIIKKFSVMDGSKEWDDEEDNSKADITIKVSDLSNSYFNPVTSLNTNTQLHEDADGSKDYEIPTTIKIRDMRSEITFEIVDYDYDDNFNIKLEFISSIKTKFKDLYADFPESITLTSGTGSTTIELEVSYTF